MFFFLSHTLLLPPLHIQKQTETHQNLTVCFSHKSSYSEPSHMHKLSLFFCDIRGASLIWRCFVWSRESCVLGIKALLSHHWSVPLHQNCRAPRAHGESFPLRAGKRVRAAPSNNISGVWQNTQRQMEEVRESSRCCTAPRDTDPSLSTRSHLYTHSDVCRIRTHTYERGAAAVPVYSMTGTSTVSLLSLAAKQLANDVSLAECMSEHDK